MRTLTTAVAVTLFFCAAATPGLAQTPQAPAPSPTFRAGVDVVQVDVSVLDKARQPVTGLTASDFQVLENGHARPIVAFTPVTVPGPAPRASAAPDVASDVVANGKPVDGRLVVIMFDWSIRGEDQAAARRIARAAVQQLGPDDLAAVVFSSAFGNAGRPQDFTADRTRLLAAVDQPMAIPAEHEDNGQLVDPDRLESGACYCLACVPETITRIADMMKEAARPKTLLFIGDYFNGENGTTQQQRVRQAPQAPYGAHSDFDPKFENEARLATPCVALMKDARDAMTRATARAHLTIDVIDPVGLAVQSPTPTIGEPVRQSQLALFADLTGGRAVMNTNATENSMPAIFNESRSYYLLGFTPGDEKSPDRKIEVKVDRHDVLVRSRREYDLDDVAEAAARTTKGEPSVASALTGITPKNDIGLAVTAIPFARPGAPGGSVVVGLDVTPPASSSTAPTSGQTQILVAAFDPKGQEVASREHTIAVTGSSPSGAVQPYEVLSRLDLPPGDYEIRAAVTAAGRQGSVYTYVTVPDATKQDLTLSGVALQATPGPLVARAAPLDDVIAINPTVGRTFAPTDEVTALVSFSEGGEQPLAPVRIVSRVVDESGHTLLEESRDVAVGEFNAARTAGWTRLLPLDDLTPGQYVLTVEATEQDHTARRDVPFTVK